MEEKTHPVFGNGEGVNVPGRGLPTGRPFRSNVSASSKDSGPDGSGTVVHDREGTSGSGTGKGHSKSDRGSVDHIEGFVSKQVMGWMGKRARAWRVQYWNYSPVLYLGGQSKNTAPRRGMRSHLRLLRALLSHFTPNLDLQHKSEEEIEVWLHCVLGHGT